MDRCRFDRLLKCRFVPPFLQAEKISGIANSRIILYNIKQMKIIRIALGILLLATLALGLSKAATAQSSDSIYVSETGHWIWGEFLDAYQANPDPQFYYGNPITDDFVDPGTKTHAQFFEKAVFELVETADGPLIQLVPLGQLLHDDQNQLADIPNEGPSCRSFSSGYNTCYAFLQFYDSFDGSNRFGLPISKVEIIDGRFVQYFEYARMEWWPDLPAGQRVKLSDLGRIYFDMAVADPKLLKPSPPPESTGSLLNPRVRVFTSHALIGGGEQQTVYVVVQDMYLRAIEAAQVEVTLSFPNGTTELYRLPGTDENGISRFTFTTADLPARSIVYLKAEVVIRGESGIGRSWFRIWW
jgi:hypothetical protein